MSDTAAHTAGGKAETHPASATAALTSSTSNPAQRSAQSLLDWEEELELQQRQQDDRHNAADEKQQLHHHHRTRSPSPRSHHDQHHQHHHHHVLSTPHAATTSGLVKSPTSHLHHAEQQLQHEGRAGPAGRGGRRLR